MEITIRLRWEASPYLTVGGCEMSFPKGWTGLRIFTRSV
jgi:hypothetical protein